jgi:hypothetical protein
MVLKYLCPDGFWTIEDVMNALGLAALCCGLALGISYAAAPETFQKLLLPCPVHFFTGLYCPGCGGTRAIRALLHGDVISSLRYHLAVPYMVLMGGCFMVSQTLWRCSRIRQVCAEKGPRIRPMQYKNAYLYVLAALYVINFLWKNIALLVFHVRVIA